MIVWGRSYDPNILWVNLFYGMRLVSGATARCNIANLYNELKWQSIKQRHDCAMATMLYKITNGLHQVSCMICEGICLIKSSDYQNLSVPFTRLESYRRSFFPSSVRLWNPLSVEIRSLPGVTGCKHGLISKLEEPNVLYYYGQRWASVHHERMQIGCSKLNADLFLKLHFLNSPKWRCEWPFKDAEHFCFQRPLYNDFQDDMFASISAVTEVLLHNILFGDLNISVHCNKLIFCAVHLLIVKSERFI